MEFEALAKGILRKRYKRFLADIVLDGDTEITAHCPNTGAMTGCAEPGSEVWISESTNPKRKLRHTLELVATATGLAYIHSAKANAVVEEALHGGLLAPLSGFDSLHREVRYGAGSRADFQLRWPDQVAMVEVKAVTLHRGDGLGVFPDAVSSRALKHVEELQEVREQGQRAAMVFCVFHAGIDRVAAAADIDPDYAQALDRAVASGVEVYALGCAISADRVQGDRALTVLTGQSAPKAGEG